MKRKSVKQGLTLAFWGMVAGFCNGLFGSGGGMIAVPALEKAGDLDTKESHATAIGVILPLALVSIYKYRNFESVDPYTLGCICIGGTLGSVAGAKLMKKFSTALIRRTFAVVILITAIRMVIM